MVKYHTVLLEWSYWIRNAKFCIPANPCDRNLRIGPSVSLAYVEGKVDANL